MGLEHSGSPCIPRVPWKGPYPKLKTKAILPLHRVAWAATWGVQGVGDSPILKRQKAKQFKRIKILHNVLFSIKMYCILNYKRAI